MSANRTKVQPSSYRLSFLFSPKSLNEISGVCVFNIKIEVNIVPYFLVR